MRIIIAGSRDVSEKNVRTALDECPWIGMASAIVSGTARGADKFGETWARENDIDVIEFPADWKQYGKRAGPLRNAEMARNADGLIAIWDGISRGTKSMIDLASKEGLRITIYNITTRLIEDREATGPVADRWELVEERAGKYEYLENLPRDVAEKLAGQASKESIA